MDEDQWDLNAVVRNVTTANRHAIAAVDDATTTTIDSILTTILSPTVIEDQLVDEFCGHQVLPGFEEITRSTQEDDNSNPFDELGKLYRPFFPVESMAPPPHTVNVVPVTSAAAAVTAPTPTEALEIFKRSLLQQQAILLQQKQHQQQLLLQRQHQHQHQQQQQQQQRQQYISQQPELPPPPYRCRKRKNDQRRTTCQVTAENILTTDKWAWRKYGQKPIKGSPYPRNYYRCSSSKGCTARKQVERSPTDPNIYVVTYTGDHCHPRPTHRNSLAGSTRTKFCVPNKPALENHHTADPPPVVPKVSSPGSSSSLSPTTPLAASMEEQDVKSIVKVEVDGGAEEEGSFADELNNLVDMVAVGGGENDDDDDIYVFDKLFDDMLIPNSMVDGDLYLSMEELGLGQSTRVKEGGSDPDYGGSGEGLDEEEGRCWVPPWEPSASSTSGGGSGGV
ncbi:hypothetical protein Dimus_000210 [Dionaea muscipula]